MVIQTLQMKAKYQQHPKNDLKITTIRTLQAIEGIRPIWEEMQRNEPYPVINGDINRYVATVKALGSGVQPHIILVKQNDKPTAMVIGRIENRSMDLKIGYKTMIRPKMRCLSVVYGGVIGCLTSDICAVLIRELMHALCYRDADVVFLNSLRIESEIYKLSKTIPGFWIRSHFTPQLLHWQTCVPNSTEEFYNSILWYSV